ncbi:hypothetical protein ACHHYP_20346 [Achlya hypogyna]|uniref:Amine oxidase domain-containing protein n=1 Tax=Achlya hypogyna TaxID=1202772 RepID=A0A1V9YQ61_ACHHY|nr:hypothetical protein ACHHYP_20346 [Achlya hypogyna]
MKVITDPASLLLIGIISLPVLFYLVKPSPRRPRRYPVPLTDEELIKQGFSPKKLPEHIDIIVIGSGIGGLTVASALAQEGKRVVVLEQHDVAGGNTHTFEEKGFEFDTGLHYIGGCLDNKHRPTRQLFDFLTNHGVEFQRLGDIVDVVVAEGPSQARDEVHIAASHEELRAQLKTKFPLDHAAIDTFFKLSREASASFRYLFGLQLVPQWLRGLYRWWYRRHFQLMSTRTKEVLESITTNPALRGAYYPIGGPSVIAKAFSRVIESYGGKVLVRAPVSSLLVSPDGAAIGVTVKGHDVYAPVVISSIGAPLTYTTLVPQPHQHRVKHLTEEFLGKESLQSPCSLMSLFIGFKTPRAPLPLHNLWKYQTWDHDANFSANRADPNAPFSALFMSFPSAKDPTYAARHPERHVALVIGANFYEHVEAFKDGRVKHRGPEYEALKAGWKARLLDEFLAEFPQVDRASVVFTELGTALTNDYYLGNYKGAIYGLGHTPERFASDIINPRTPIANLYLTGQDVVSCGIVGAMFGGLTTAAVVSPAFFKRLGSLMTPS